MDIALILDRLVPQADYYGSLTDNTEAAYDALTWNDVRTKPTFAEIQTASTETYEDVSTLQEKQDFSEGENYCAYRNYLITTYVSVWDSQTTDDQKILVKNYVYPSDTPESELNALYPESERDEFQKEVIYNLQLAGCDIRPGGTGDASFEIKVDDQGVISTIEVLTDVTL